MRLGFHYHVPAIQRDGLLWMPAYFGLFIDSLAACCESLVYFHNTPVGGELERMDYSLISTNVRMVDLGPHITIPLRVLRVFPRLLSLYKWQSELDVMLIRAPTPLQPMISLFWRKPVALLLVSDQITGIENLPQPAWRKTLIRWWASWNQVQLIRAAQHSLVFVNSRMLYEQYKGTIPHLIETQTTTLNQNDFYIRDDTCKGLPYRLLYAGRMTRIKGLFEIVTALSNLVNSGFDVVLDLVGMIDKSDPVLDELRILARTHGIEERIHYHGYKTAGPELLAYYRRADIYVIASQSSNEGFPRTIWEAMASSLPVVATQVGSIPAFIQDAAILVPPKDGEALTAALKALFTYPELRQSLIRKGMALAKQNTLGKRADELVSQIVAWLASEGNA